MANRGRDYAENLIGPLDRSAYNQQRNVIQNTYNTNWQNVQNQYKNLQDKLKLQQEQANRDFAEGLVDVAENSLNRQRIGSGNLANRGLSASGLTNMLNQADTAQKGEEIGNLLKSAGAISADTADRLSQANSKYAEESSNLMGRLSDTLAGIGDAETAAQNRYNQTLANIAGAMDQREANNAAQAAQRAGVSKSDADNALEEFYKRATINEILSNPDMTDQQKQNYLGIMFGIDNAGRAVEAYNTNINATDTYNKRLEELQKAADKEFRQNRINANRYFNNQQTGGTNLSGLPERNLNERFSSSDPLDNYLQRNINSSYSFNNGSANPVSEFRNQLALDTFKNQGITFEDLAALLYGNR